MFADVQLADAACLPARLGRDENFFAQRLRRRHGTQHEQRCVHVRRSQLDVAEAEQPQSEGLEQNDVLDAVQFEAVGPLVEDAFGDAYALVRYRIAKATVTIQRQIA